MACGSLFTNIFTRPSLSSSPSNPNSKTHLNSPSSRASLKVSAAAIEDDPVAEKSFRAKSISDFVRFNRSEFGGELQTTVVSYRKKFPQWLLKPFLQVDLVSTIHIADKEYFETLETELESYDCILYEMVASRESLENRMNSASTRKLKKSSRGFNIIGFIQRQMARLLLLDFQLDCLDYQGEKWQHADLDFETFKQLQHERGESLFSLAKEMTIRSTKAVMQPTHLPGATNSWRTKLLQASRVLPMPLVGLLLITTLCSPFGGSSSEYSELDALSQLDIAAALKIFIAKRLTSEFTDITAAIEEESVIIGERNRIATETLRRAIEDGHKRIAVLYGGGHMPDLGRRLQEEFDMVPFREQWITAWSIKRKDLNINSLPFLKTLAELLGWPLNRYQTLALLLFSSVLALDLWFWELFVGYALEWVSSAAQELSLFTDSTWLMRFF